MQSHLSNDLTIYLTLLITTFFFKVHLTRSWEKDTDTSVQHTRYKGFFKDESSDKLLKQSTQNSHLAAILPDEQEEIFCALFFLFAIYKKLWEAGYPSLEYS